MNDNSNLETRIYSLGRGLLEAAAQSAPASRAAWLDRLILQAIDEPDFRVQTLRFIDVLPTLREDAELVGHLKDYFSGLELPWPEVSGWSLRHSDAPWALHIAAPLLRATLRALSRRFMGGHNLTQARRTIEKLNRGGMGYTLDLLGEAVVSETEAQRYQQAYLDLLQGLPPGEAVENETRRPQISLKLSALYSQWSPLDPAGGVAAIAARLRPILSAARARQIGVTVDMEQYEFKHIVMQCFMAVLNEPQFRDWPDAGVAVQAYLRESRDDLRQLIDWAKRRGAPVHIRLVRGAYWDYETVIARQHGWPVPVWEAKAQTDACFEDCLAELLAHPGAVLPAVASHNVRSLACTMARAEEHHLPAEHVEFQMLYGMADELKQALVAQGRRLRVYVPFGETLPGMAYLVRRLLENSTGQTILDSGIAPSRLQAAILERPQAPAMASAAQAPRHFPNEPVHRFTAASERAEFAAALAAVREQLGRDYPLVIGGQAMEGTGQITSTNPTHPAELIGHVAAAGRVQADAALAAAETAFPGWSRLSASDRAGYLRRIAAALIAARDEFAAWQVLEAGKNWSEADADVCEAIDFLTYYAQQAERLAEGRRVALAGEDNRLDWRPKGVGLVIAPWNFPLAILTGMLSATLVTGNTAILKPSSLTPVIAARFMRLIEAAGLPPGVVNFLPGAGGEVGAYLAARPDIHLIAFTGSRAVGTRLIELGAQLQDGQRHVKRVIAEMGGKNAIIIDADADLDAAIPGVLASALGYQGQKCSAASRVIVVGEMHDAFLERLVAATRSLTIGDPAQPGHFLGPVIDAGAQQRIRSVIEDGAQRARLALYEPQSVPQAGCYVAPAIFADVAPEDALAQEEIFGPVLALLRATDFEQALAIANGTSYALTGGVYSRRPAHLQRAREAFRVGNLYLNRKITGALVARQPFGGFRLSGIGSKAGGEDYLKQFTDPVCVTENTLRRGFAPDADETG
ncbi:MAG: proline dehydrogenase family protein [Gammaproteobacteria bacterium]|jgi:RHH-type proline utilization regulon transcriptional repressor/proline dehydrogenase/delta 1-pyrroline-5-carboxylate dehydrogenase